MDYLVKAIALNGTVRAYAIKSTNLVSELQKSHQTWPTASAALGRTATVGAMMGNMLKGREKLTLQIKGDGPLGQIVVDANPAGEVRGYVSNPSVHLPLNAKGKLDVAGAVGSGYLYVIKDLGMKEPYRGSVPLVSGEIGEDFTYYFANSEQTPSAIGVGVLVNPDNTIKAAGGFMIQVLPGIDDKDIDQLEQVISTIPAVSHLIDQGLSPEDILKRIFEEDLEIIDRQEIHYKCSCSYERIEGMLISLGKNELEGIIQEEEQAEIVCQFCNTKYHYPKERLKEILLEIK